MRPILFLPLSVLWLFLPSCGKKAPAKAPEAPPAAVTFQPAATETVTLRRDLPGRIDAVRVAEVRARVAGILLKRTFQEGAEVKAGDVLFQIDQAPLEAARDSAEANLVRAQATLDQTENEVKRFRELIAVNAVSKQAADNAESAVAVASADLLAAKAARATAELNLGYATVTAPISGRTGKAQVTEGALVGQNDATLLAIIQQLDPIYFDFTQSSSDLLALKKAGSAENKVTLVLEDGTEYAHPGKLLFSEASVDPTTGMVTLRAEFPNPDKDLLPGMFARARVVQAVKENVVTVLQRAVTRGQGGSGTVMVIDEQNVVHPRVITTAEMTGNKWIVTSGLKSGERVIIEGLQKAKPGAAVDPAPFEAATAAVTPPAPEKAAASSKH